METKPTHSGSTSTLAASAFQMVQTITVAPDPNVLTASNNNNNNKSSVIHEQVTQKVNSLPSFIPSSAIGVQKINSLPTLTSGLVTPAAVAKATKYSSSEAATTPHTQQSSITQQLSFLNSTSQANTNILIKTTKTNVSGQPTYVAISIPAHSSTSTGQRQVIPLAIHQLKLKQEGMSSSAESGNRASTQAVSSYRSSDQQGYGSSQSTHTMVSSFPYDGSNESAMYSTQPSNIASYMEAHNPSQAQMYQSYQSQTGHPGSMGVGVSPQAIGVAQQAQYLQPGQAASQRVPISHTTRASPITVQWLLENYETADGVSLPRSTLYHHYLRHCAENKIDAVNAASFGKLIRSVFLGLKTRRLGTRGNSKYHYYGIRVKPNSPLARLTDDTQVALRAQPSVAKRTVSSSNYDEDRQGRNDSSTEPEEGSAHSSHIQYLGDCNEGLPEGPAIDLIDQLPEGISKQDIINFGNYYRIHCEALLEVISTLQFEHVESLWQSFYKSPAAINKNDNGTLESNDYDINKADLITLCKYQPVINFIKETDYILYQTLVNVLVPDVLRAVPSSLTQIVRNFAKSLENMLIGSMSEMPKEIVNVKIAAVGAFSQTLRRYTSLNHLAQAARAVLQNPQQITQMWNDLNKVDFNNVKEQSSWVCQCDEALITKLEQDFKQTLAQQQSLEQWAHWLETVVAMVLEQHQGQDTYPKAARQFLLNWSFYSSMIIRDLTLRSAASFGSFHLIRLLYDEYMFYLIEHKVAEYTGKSPMSVMAECIGMSTIAHADFNGSTNENEEEELDDSSNDGIAVSQPPTVTSDAQSAAQSELQGYETEPMMKRLKQEYT